ncbi:MAG: hypothetical protein WBV77_16690 [Solirubrobacteraceae bacterium]
MSSVVSLAASGVLMALGVWLFAGFVSRTCGAVLAQARLLPEMAFRAPMLASPGDEHAQHD